MSRQRLLVLISGLALAVVGVAWLAVSACCRRWGALRQSPQQHDARAGTMAKKALAAPTEADCRRALKSILVEINEIHREEGLPAVPLQGSMPFELYHSTHYATQLGVLGGPELAVSPVRARFLGEGCALVVFENNLGSDMVWGPRAKSYDRPTKPQWSREKAMAVGAKLLRALVRDDRLRSLKLRSAVYDWMIMEDSRYFSSVWTLRWARVSSEGHEFVQDDAGMRLSEVAGLLVFGLSFYSRYEGQPRTLLDASRAVELARHYLAEGEGVSSAGGQLSNLKLAAGAGPQLMVVNPSRPGSHEGVDGAGGRPNTNARLAWVVTFRATRSHPKEKGHSGGSLRIEIVVCVDAETGEPLGESEAYCPETHPR